MVRKYDVEVFTQEESLAASQAYYKSKDKSMFWCFGSLLLFTFVLCVILLSLVLSQMENDIETLAQSGGGNENETSKITQSGMQNYSALRKNNEGISSERQHFETSTLITPLTSREVTNILIETSDKKEKNKILIGEAKPLTDDDDDDDEDMLKYNVVNNKPCQPERSAPTCDLNVCRKESALLMSAQRFTADPCTHFYDHTCGGFQDAAILADFDSYAGYLATLSGASEVIDSSIPGPKSVWKNFMESCLDFPFVNHEIRVTSLRKMFNSVGKFYTNDDELPPGDLDLTRPLSLLLLMGIPLFFEVSIEHEASLGTFVLTLSPTHQSQLWPSSTRDATRDCTILELQTYIQGRTKSCEQKSSQFTEITKTAIALFSDVSVDNETLLEITHSLEWSLAHSLSVEKSRLLSSAEQKHLLITVEEMQNLFAGFINWKEFFVRLSSKEVDDHTMVRIYMSDYFDSLRVFLLRSPRNAHNLLKALYAYELHTRFLQEVDVAREDYCLRLIDGIIKDISSALYLDTFNPDDITKVSVKIKNLFNESKYQLADQILKSPCLDLATREKMKHKLLEDTNLVLEFEDVKRHTWDILKSSLKNLKPGVAFIEDTIMWVRRERELMYSLWGEGVIPPDLRWVAPATAHSHDLIFLYHTNTVFVPLHFIGALHNDDGLPRHLIEAKYGFHFARALAAAIDFKGSESFGVLPRPYETIKEHYIHNSEVPLSIGSLSININDASVNLRLADDLAMRVAFSNAFGESVVGRGLPGLSETMQQQFFLSLMRQACVKKPMSYVIKYLLGREPFPDIIRLSSALVTFSEFALAFKCPRFDGDEASVFCLGEN